MQFKVFGPVGCEQCGNTGFKGRVGLYEAILTDDTIAKIMAKVPTPTERDIKKAAEHQKIFTMIEDGVIKILTGVTSLDEIQSVVDLGEDVGEQIATTPQSEVLPPIQTPPSLAEPRDTSPYKREDPKFIPMPQEVDELLVLIDYLKALEHDLENQQRLNHEVHIENQLANIRNNIQTMLREVAQ